MAMAESGAPARERLIRAASDLFRRYGAAAVGVDAILAEAGVAKATLYKIFGSKDALMEAVLERRAAEWRAWFFGELENAGREPRAQLAHAFAALRLWFENGDAFFRPWFAALGERERADGRLHDIAHAHAQALREGLERIARAAAAPAPRALAEQMLVLIDGAVAGAVLSGTAHAATIAGEAFERLFDGPSKKGGNDAPQGTDRAHHGRGQRHLPHDRT